MNADTAFHLGMCAAKRINGLRIHMRFYRRVLMDEDVRDMNGTIETELRILKRMRAHVLADQFEFPDQIERYLYFLDHEVDEP